MARLLIIDDNDNIRFLMRSFIEQAGHLVCGEAADGVAGVELAKRTLPDLILLDFTMPALSGTETAAMLKQVLPDTPIILFTLHGDEINRRFAAVMGADLVVNKADGIPAIAESVKTLLARKIKTSPSVAENRVSDNEPAKSAYESPSKKTDVH